MRILGLLLAAAAVVACVVSPAAAQAPVSAFVGQRVVEVQLVAEGRPVVDPMLGGLIETHEGKYWDRQ